MAVFNLFDAEERTLEQARALQGRLADAPDEVKAGLATLVEAYGRSVREQRRLVKVSDRLQGQLASVNQELDKRRAEAEETLDHLKATQESLIQAEKLASLGALVGGVAHEINTPVGIALSCASHLADAATAMRALFDADNIGIDDFERFLRTLSDTTGLILANCERAAELIRGFKQVAVDRTSSERRRFDLCAYVRETMASLGPQLRQSGHQIAIDCPGGIAMDSYPGALSQVLSNFVMNSLVHGFAPGNTGTLTIRIDVLEPDQVRIVYSDDGRGIDPDHLGRVFDPFFTTKRGSGGSGLGLHIVYNLVTGPLKGSLGVQSEPGQGTTFTLTMPQRLPVETP